MLYVTPPTYRHTMPTTWNPWRALRDRDHLTFAYSRHAQIGGGAIYARRGTHAAIIIDPDMPRSERNAALAHELIHDERGGLPTGAPDWIVTKEEHAVDLEVVARLVPATELRRFLEQRATVGTVTVHDVAEEFDVPTEIASSAMRSTR